MQCDLTKIQTIINLCTCIVNFHVEEILVGCWFRRVVLHKLLPKSLNLPEVARMININFLLTTRFFLVTPLDSMGFQSTAMEYFDHWMIFIRVKLFLPPASFHDQTPSNEQWNLVKVIGHEQNVCIYNSDQKRLSKTYISLPATHKRLEGRVNFGCIPNIT